MGWQEGRRPHLRPIKRSRQISDGLNLIALVVHVMALSLGLDATIDDASASAAAEAAAAAAAAGRWGGGAVEQWCGGAVVRWGGGAVGRRRGGARRLGGGGQQSDESVLSTRIFKTVETCEYAYF